MIRNVIRLLGGKPGEQTICFFRASESLVGVSEDFVIARELDQHQRLAVTQFRCRPAELRHVVEQTFGLDKKTQRCCARHVIFLRLRHSFVDDLGRALERGIEECLVGLELLPGIGRAAACRDSEQEKNARQRRPEPVASMARPFRAPHNLVKTEAEQPRYHLLLSDLLAVALRTRVGRNRLLALACNLSIRPDFVLQRPRKAFARGIAWLAADDHWDHALGAGRHFEATHFLVDVLALRRAWRANDDEEIRGFERGNGLLGERMSCRKVLAVTKDRPQRLRHRTGRRVASDQILVDAISFERGM